MKLSTLLPAIISLASAVLTVPIHITGELDTHDGNQASCMWAEGPGVGYDFLVQASGPWVADSAQSFASILVQQCEPDNFLPQENYDDGFIWDSSSSKAHFTLWGFPAGCVETSIRLASQSTGTISIDFCQFQSSESGFWK